MLNAMSPRLANASIFAVMLATIAGAWAFQYAGYDPCELCLKQRWAYYAIVPFTLLMTVWNPSWVKQTLWLSLLVLLASTALAMYHAGIEWHWWPGPDTCTGGNFGDGLPDLTKAVVKCDEPTLKILGMSLAAWNAQISATMAYVAFLGTRTPQNLPQGSSSESQ